MRRYIGELVSFLVGENYLPSPGGCCDGSWLVGRETRFIENQMTRSRARAPHQGKTLQMYKESDPGGRRCVAKRTQLVSSGQDGNTNPCLRPGIGRGQRIEGHSTLQGQRGTEAKSSGRFRKRMHSTQAPGNSGCDGLEVLTLGINGVAGWLCVPFGHWR